MNIKSFIRNVSLFKLGISELDINEKQIYNFLVDELSDLNLFRYDHTNIIYYGISEDNLILKYHPWAQIMWVNYNPVWAPLVKNKAITNTNEIPELLKWWFGTTLGIKIMDIQPINISIRITPAPYEK